MEDRQGNRAHTYEGKSRRNLGSIFLVVHSLAFLALISQSWVGISIGTTTFIVLRRVRLSSLVPTN